jgi:hypothetical protein
MMTVPLYGAKAAGRDALVDDADYELVSQYRWNVWEVRRSNGTMAGPYARSLVSTGGSKITIYMHGLIMCGIRIDHADHDGLNNQRSNLRPVTQSQNARNARPYAGGASPFKGVHWHQSNGKWEASVRAGGKYIFRARFVSEEAAARAYDAAAREAFGEYACLNFPDDHDTAP